jgi:hypothetical protein
VEITDECFDDDVVFALWFCVLRLVLIKSVDDCSGTGFWQVLWSVLAGSGRSFTIIHEHESWKRTLGTVLDVSYGPSSGYPLASSSRVAIGSRPTVVLQLALLVLLCIAVGLNKHLHLDSTEASCTYSL